MKKGIDISSHNGKLDFAKLAKEVDFVMVRAGFGTKSIDAMADRNIKGCNDNGIPVGVYWFSYAHDVESAEKEAENCCQFILQHEIDYPVAFDFEYDSEAYIKKWYNITVTSTLLCNMANAFFEVVKRYGFIPMLYTNLDYINRGFKSIINNQPLWLAQWGVEKPSYECSIWQASDKYKINGINSTFDLNYKYETSDYNGNEDKKDMTDVQYKDILKNIIDSYYPVAQDVLRGVYGNGKTRKDKLRANGYEPVIVQCIVNELVK